MVKQINLGSAEDDFYEFEYGGEKIKLDLLEVGQKIFEMSKARKEFPNTEGSLMEDVQGYLDGKGLKGISRTATAKFLKFFGQLSVELKKNIDSAQLFPASTASTPSHQAV